MIDFDETGLYKGFVKNQKGKNSLAEVHIVCPYCGEIHSHGAAEGTRIPHCHCNEPDYNILDWEKQKRKGKGDELWL